MQDLRDLFTRHAHTRSDTYDCMCIGHLADASSERLLAAPGRWRNQARTCPAPMQPHARYKLQTQKCSHAKCRHGQIVSVTMVPGVPQQPQ